MVNDPTWPEGQEVYQPQVNIFNDPPAAEPFWLRALDASAPWMYPSLLGAGTAATAISARNYINLLTLAQRVVPVADEMLELAVPMLGGEG